MNEFVTLKTYMFPHELLIERSKLESQNIECLTRDELTVQIHNFYSHALGGIRLQVRLKDLEKAKEILNEFPDLNEDEKLAEKETVARCPNCNSSNVTKIKLNGVKSLVVLFLIGLPIPFPARKYQCYNCHTQFKAK